MALTLMAAFLLRLSLWTLYTQSSSASRFTARRLSALVAAHHLAVDQAGPHLEVVHSLHHERVTGRPIVASVVPSSASLRLASYNATSGRLQQSYRATIRVAFARPDFRAEVTRD